MCVLAVGEYLVKWSYVVDIDNPEHNVHTGPKASKIIMPGAS
jgi:hypothetical protein